MKSSYQDVPSSLISHHIGTGFADLSLESVTRQFLDRIDSINEKGPYIRAITWINPEATAIARLKDQMPPAGILHGVSIAVKDNIDMKGVPTTAGFVPLADSIPARNAKIVDRLTDAGSIIIAKTNMSELALSNDRLGYSSTFGVTKNPFNIDRNASGSSSGSAAAVAAGFVAAAIGTDTAGSIRAPASVTGLVGFKPTWGRIPMSGIVPLSPSLDVPGPITKSVFDAAAIYSVLVGDTEAQTRFFLKRLQADKHNISTLNLLYLEDIPGISAQVREVYARFLDLMRNSPASISMTDERIFTPSLWPTLQTFIQREFRDSFSHYLSRLKKGPKSLADVIASAEAYSAVNPKRLEQLTKINKGQGITDAARSRPESVAERYRERVSRLLQSHNADVLVFPTMLCPASPLYGEGKDGDDTYLCPADDPYITSYLANVTGFPEITIPIGLTLEGLPVGVSILATSNRDKQVLLSANKLEGLISFHHKPLFMPK